MVLEVLLPGNSHRHATHVPAVQTAQRVMVQDLAARLVEAAASIANNAILQESVRPVMGQATASNVVALENRIVAIVE